MSRVFLIPALLLPLLALYLLLQLITEDLKLSSLLPPRDQSQHSELNRSDSGLRPGLVKTDEEGFYERLQERLRNIPVVHWWRTRNEKVKEKCDKVPDILSLHYNNEFWQVLETDTATLYLYAAYLDNRRAPSPPLCPTQTCIQTWE